MRGESCVLLTEELRSTEKQECTLASGHHTSHNSDEYVYRRLRLRFKPRPLGGQVAHRKYDLQT